MARKSRKNLDCKAVEPVSSMSALYSAAAYVRLSADAKRKPGDSLENQRNIIENYIAASSDIRLAEVYIDNYETGRQFDRPAFQKMLKDIENRRVNCIIVKDLSRFGRNAIDTGYYIEKYLPSLNCRVIAVTDGFDSNDGDGGIMLPLKNVIAEAYALDISRKCKAVQRQNIADGRFVGRMASYGFALSPQDCHKLVVDEEAAAVVRQIFEWASNGMTPGEIARGLNEAAILPPNRYKFEKGVNSHEKLLLSEFWQAKIVAEMLIDRMYVGDMVQGKTQKVNGKYISIPREKWVVVPNTHELIVSRDIFDKVQKIRQRVAESNAEKQYVGAYTPHIFKGKVFCAKCGHLTHRHRQNKDGTYWFRCESRWKFSKDACTVVSVKEADLKAEIVAVIHRHAEVILGKFVHLERDIICGDTSGAAELREINTKLDKDGRMLRSLYESMVDGVITRDEFVRMKADYEAKIADLSCRANEIRNARYTAEDKIHECQDLVEAVAAVLADDRLTEEIIDKLVEKVLVNPDKSVEIHFIFADVFGGEHCG